jgi:hypothetical protein
MAEIIYHDGTPVIVGRTDKHYPYLRIRPKPRKLRDKPFKNMNEQQKQALRNIAEMGIERKIQAVIAAGYSEANAKVTANRLIQSKPIIDALKNEGESKIEVANIIARELRANHTHSKSSSRIIKSP